MTKSEDKHRQSTAGSDLVRLIAAVVGLVLLILLPPDLLSGFLRLLATISVAVLAIKFAIARSQLYFNRRQALEELRVHANLRAQIDRSIQRSSERKAKRRAIDRQRGIEAKKRHKEEKTRVKEQQDLDFRKIQGVDPGNRFGSSVNPLKPELAGYTETKDFGQTSSTNSSSSASISSRILPNENPEFNSLNKGTGHSSSFEASRQKQYLARLLRVNQTRKNNQIV